MKKLIFLLLTSVFLSFSVFAQETERELSNYEKYILAKEQAAVAPDTVYNNDTVYVEVQAEQPHQAVVNNYYIDNTPDIRHSLYFGHSWNFYRYYDPFYYDPFYSNYYSWGYPYYSYRPFYNNYWYSGNYWSYNYNHTPYYSYNYRNRNRYGSAGVLGNRRNYYSPSFNTYKSGYATLNKSGAKSAYSRQTPVSVNRTVSIDRRSGNVVNVQTKSPYNNYVRTSANTKPTYNINRNGQPVPRLNQNAVNRSTNPNRTQSETNVNRNGQPVQRMNQNRSYTPSYSTPKMSTRPQYNNSRATTTPSRSYSAPTQSRSSSSFNSGSSGMSRSSSGSSSSSRSSGNTSTSSGTRRR